MNTLTTKIVYEVRKFANFRKRLIHDFKKGGKHDHRNTHALPLELKQKLLNSKKGGDWKKIRELQRQSLTPYGRFAKHGFIFQKDKLPFYDIPNVDGFELKPYVQYLTPLLDSSLTSHQLKVNEEKIQQMNIPTSAGQIDSPSNVKK